MSETLWQTFPVYVTMTNFPFSSWIVSFNFILHSSRLHSPAPRKNGAEFILREFAARTWLFLKRKLHQGLLFLIPRLNIVVQAPPNRRPPLGNSLMSMSSHSLFVSLNFAFWPSRSNRKKRSSSSSEITSCDKGKRKTISESALIIKLRQSRGFIVSSHLQSSSGKSNQVKSLFVCCCCLVFPTMLSKFRFVTLSLSLTASPCTSSSWSTKNVQTSEGWNYVITSCIAVTRCGGHRSLRNVLFKDIFEERDKAERKE